MNNMKKTNKQIDLGEVPSYPYFPNLTTMTGTISGEMFGFFYDFYNVTMFPTISVTFADLAIALH